MAALSDAGPVADGQPVTRLAGPGRYRTRQPVIVEAIQYTGDNDDAVAAFAGWGWTCVPPGCYVVKGVTGHFFTVDADRFAATYEPADGQRPGDQPLPVPNDGPSMHDLVADDVRRRHPGGRAPEITGVVRDLAARKQLGLERYRSLLQAGNGRDAARDLYEELLDSLVYCRQWLEENEAEDGGHGFHGKAMWSVYQGLLTHTLAVRALMDARAGEAGHG